MTTSFIKARKWESTENVNEMEVINFETDIHHFALFHLLEAITSSSPRVKGEDVTVNTRK